MALDSLIPGVFVFVLRFLHCFLEFCGRNKEGKRRIFALEMDGKNKLSIGWTDLEGTEVTEGTHEMGGTGGIGGNT